MYNYFSISRARERVINKCLSILFTAVFIGLLEYINFTFLQDYVDYLCIAGGVYMLINAVLAAYYQVVWYTSTEVIVHVHQNHYFPDLRETYIMWDIDGEVSVAFANNINLIEEFQIDDENDIPNGKFVDYNFYLPNDIEQSQLSYETERSYKEYSEIVLQLITTSPYDEDYYLKVTLSPLTRKFEIIERLKK